MRSSPRISATDHEPGFGWTGLEESSVVAAVATNQSGRIVWANQLFCSLIAAPTEGDIVGQKLRYWLEDPEVWPALDGPASARKGVELTLRRNDQKRLCLHGDVHVAELASTGTCLLGVFADATEVEQLRAAMHRGARLAAVGTLTSGIAHDFNNLLTVLVGNLALVAEELREDAAKFTKLKAARDAATRGSELIRQLLAFAREEPGESDLISPGKIVKKIAPLVDRALGSRIELSLDIGTEPVGSVRGNTAQLESAIVNLAVNARDALGSGGRVTIRVHATQLEQAAAERLGLPGGNYVRLEVEDDGCGIPREALEHVFEPFFSTKLDRGGTGLGLGMVRAYAEHFGGTATIDSEVGKGTRVSLLFPLSSSKLDDSVAMTMPLSTLPTGDERIVLVSPEDGVLSTVEQILSVLGYEVRSAESPAEAKLLLRDARPDLCIIDGYDAAPLMAALQAQGQEVARCRAIQLAASSDAAKVDCGEGLSVLVKPFSLADLATAVRERLDAPR